MLELDDFAQLLQRDTDWTQDVGYIENPLIEAWSQHRSKVLAAELVALRSFVGVSRAACKLLTRNIDLQVRPGEVSSHLTDAEMVN